MGQNSFSGEAKVDYLLKIYFSGENKEGIVKNMLVTLQELEDKISNPSLSEQYSFLYEMQDNVSQADDTCDALDFLSVGIYELDAAEAAEQGVMLPTDKAKVKSGEALANLNKVSSKTRALSRTATNVAVAGLLAKSGGSKLLGSIANTSQVVGDVASVANETSQSAIGIADLGKSLGFTKKDKPCSKVPQKEIQIGPHHIEEVLMVATTSIEGDGIGRDTLKTVITVSNLSFSSLRTITDTLVNKTEIHAVDKAYNEKLTTITVSHFGNTDELAEWIYDKLNHMLKLVAYDTGTISFAAR
ncbi:hypothetical protein GCM10009119_10860 [Algoriphagus jejuensis]|uniref:Uncharacterized protein n=2 Tax=Algoriphagus jejuensis TaxID=419934 RepID=A0ABP3YB53_9BACT